mgnify:CR=1 FL=1
MQWCLGNVRFDAESGQKLSHFEPIRCLRNVSWLKDSPPRDNKRSQVILPNLEYQLRRLFQPQKPFQPVNIIIPIDHILRLDQPAV